MAKKNKISDSEKNLETFLLLWAFLPVFILSFSSIKEVTYILPSYVGIAILCAAWLDERITKPDTSDKAIVIFSIAVIPVCFASFILAPISAPAYIIAVSIWMAAGLPFVIMYACKLRFMRMAVVIAAIVLCGVILGNTPEVMRKTGLNRKCHIDLAKYVFDKVGDKEFWFFDGLCRKISKK
jgi:hypothetical protein